MAVTKFAMPLAAVFVIQMTSTMIGASKGWGGNQIADHVSRRGAKDLPAEQSQDPTDELRRKLEGPSDLLKTGIDKSTTLRDALKYYFHEKGGLAVKIDVAAFAQNRIKNLDDSTIEVPPLPKIPLGKSLQLVLEELEPDAKFVVKRDHVLIVPGKPTPPQDESKMTPEARELAKLLGEPTDRFKNGIDRGTPFKDAMDFLCRGHGGGGGVKYVIQDRAFRLRGTACIVEKQVQFPPTAKAPFDQLLLQFLAQVDATYLVQSGGYLLIVPAKPKGK